jgi:hypothetical protein
VFVELISRCYARRGRRRRQLRGASSVAEVARSGGGGCAGWRRCPLHVTAAAAAAGTARDGGGFARVWDVRTMGHAKSTPLAEALDFHILTSTERIQLIQVSLFVVTVCDDALTVFICLSFVRDENFGCLLGLLFSSRPNDTHSLWSWNHDIQQQKPSTN